MMSSSGFSPGVFLSPPTLASTPSIIPFSRLYSLPQPFDLCSGISGNRNSSRQKQYFPLTELPVLVLDKVFALLSDQDLRAFHQVCRTWNSTLENRVGDNNRRLELVRKIRENKENIQNGSKELPTPDLNRVSRERTTDRKSEDVVLLECTNLINTSDASSTNDNTTGNPLLTPTSRFAFQSFEEAEKSLKKGQKLFRCRRCSGPVPSPILAGSRSTEEENEGPDAAKNRIEATRCRLTTRMGTVTPDDSQKLRDRKKSRTFTSMPPPLSPIDIPTTTALGDRLSHSLVISGATWSPAAYRKLDQFDENIVEEAKDTSSTSVGIDLHLTARSDASSIDIKLNFTNSFDSSPFSIHQWKNSQHSIAESCLSESDAELSSNEIESSSRGKSLIFPNLIPSPMKILTSSCGNKLESIPTTAVQKDFMKPITLKSSLEGLVLKSNIDYYSTKHDKYDIDSSTYERHSKISNDINGMHDKSLIVCGDREGQKSTNVGDVSRSLVPSLSFGGSGKFSCSTSDYFSSAGSILRDESKSYFPEISTGKYEMNCRSLNESAIYKSQSLGNMTTDEKEEAINVSYESSASCPNLNESFVLECPNPSCFFRFCSTCSMGEHPGRSCHIICSESFEELNESNENKCFGNVSQNKNKSNRVTENLGKGKGKGTGNNNNKEKNSKKSLRRIAKL